MDKCCSNEIDQQRLSWMILYLHRLSSPAGLLRLLFRRPKCISTFENRIQVPGENLSGSPIYFLKSIGDDSHDWFSCIWEPECGSLSGSHMNKYQLVLTWRTGLRTSSRTTQHWKKQDFLPSIPAQKELGWRPKIIQLHSTIYYACKCFSKAFLHVPPMVFPVTFLMFITMLISNKSKSFLKNNFKKLVLKSWK